MILSHEGAFATYCRKILAHSIPRKGPARGIFRISEIKRLLLVSSEQSLQPLLQAFSYFAPAIQSLRALDHPDLVELRVPFARPRNFATLSPFE